MKNKNKLSDNRTQTRDIKFNISQHTSISSRTNLPVKTAKPSIMEHTKTSFSVNNIIIVIMAERIDYT